MKSKRRAFTPEAIMSRIYRVGRGGLLLMGLGLLLVVASTDLPYPLQAIIVDQPMLLSAAACTTGLSLLAGGIALAQRARRLHRCTESLVLTSRAVARTDAGPSANRRSENQAICPEISGAEAERVYLAIRRLEHKNWSLVGWASVLMALGELCLLGRAVDFVGVNLDPELSGWMRILAWTPWLVIILAGLNFRRIRRMRLFARALGLVLERYEPVAKSGPQPPRFGVPKNSPPDKSWEKPPDLELYEIAYLAGGTERVIDTILAELARDGLLTTLPGGTLFHWKIGPERRLNSVEEALFGKRRRGYRERAQLRYINTDSDGCSLFDAEMHKLTKNLETRGLVRRSIDSRHLYSLGLLCAVVLQRACYYDDLWMAVASAECLFFLATSISPLKDWRRTKLGHAVFQDVEKKLDNRSFPIYSALLRVAVKGVDPRLIDRRLSRRSGNSTINRRWAVGLDFSSLLDTDTNCRQGCI